MQKSGVVGCVLIVAGGLFLSGDGNAGSLEPPGPPAPTMKTIQDAEPRIAIKSVPFTISAPGSYYLAGNLTGVSGQNGITITTSQVTVDLNGFALVGVSGSAAGIIANLGNQRQISIRNGVVKGWGNWGILLNSADSHVDDLRIELNGFDGLYAGQHTIVQDTIATLNGATGITVGPASVITGCTVIANTSHGIVADIGSTVSGTVSGSNGSLGFQLNSDTIAANCTAVSNLTGFSLGARSRVTHSLARANGVGFNGTSGGVAIEECTAGANTNDGIFVVSSSVVRGNTAVGNTNDGIQASGTDNVIEGNVVSLGSTGIRVDAANNLIVKNRVSSTTTFYSIVAGNKVGTISPDPATAGPWANF